MSELIAGIVISALGGSIVTAFGLMVAFSSRLARIETKLDSFCAQVDSLSLRLSQTRQEHEKLSSDVARHDERLKGIEKKREDA